MYVRLANAWTDQHGARHQAGDTVEVDNVTLAELEAGGYVTTNEEGQNVAKPAGWMGPGGTTQAKPAGWMGPGDEPATDDTTAKAADAEKSGDDEGVAKPDSDGWPGVG